VLAFGSTELSACDSQRAECGLGISGNTISRYERGVHQHIKFTIAQMKRLQELLEKAGLSIKDLPDDVE
jgi:transcriptional regulator with XRE-family HTH domain